MKAKWPLIYLTQLAIIWQLPSGIYLKRTDDNEDGVQSGTPVDSTISPLDETTLASSTKPTEKSGMWSWFNQKTSQTDNTKKKGFWSNAWWYKSDEPPPTLHPDHISKPQNQTDKAPGLDWNNSQEMVSNWRTIFNENQTETLVSEFGKRITKFVQCLGTDWFNTCTSSRLFLCGVNSNPWQCVSDIYCNANSYYMCKTYKNYHEDYHSVREWANATLNKFVRYNCDQVVDCLVDLGISFQKRNEGTNQTRSRNTFHKIDHILRQMNQNNQDQSNTNITNNEGEDKLLKTSNDNKEGENQNENRESKDSDKTRDKKKLKKKMLEIEEESDDHNNKKGNLEKETIHHDIRESKDRQRKERPRSEQNGDENGNKESKIAKEDDKKDKQKNSESKYNLYETVQSVAGQFKSKESNDKQDQLDYDKNKKEIDDRSREIISKSNKQDQDIEMKNRTEKDEINSNQKVFSSKIKQDQIKISSDVSKSAKDEDNDENDDKILRNGIPGKVDSTTTEVEGSSTEDIISTEVTTKIPIQPSEKISQEPKKVPGHPMAQQGGQGGQGIEITKNTPPSKKSDTGDIIRNEFASMGIGMKSGMRTRLQSSMQGGSIFDSDTSWMSNSFGKSSNTGLGFKRRPSLPSLSIPSSNIKTEENSNVGKDALWKKMTSSEFTLKPMMVKKSKLGYKRKIKLAKAFAIGRTQRIKMEQSNQAQSTQDNDNDDLVDTKLDINLGSIV